MTEKTLFSGNESLVSTDLNALLSATLKADGVLCPHYMTWRSTYDEGNPKAYKEVLHMKGAYVLDLSTNKAIVADKAYPILGGRMVFSKSGKVYACDIGSQNTILPFKIAIVKTDGGFTKFPVHMRVIDPNSRKKKYIQPDFLIIRVIVEDVDNRCTVLNFSFFSHLTRVEISVSTEFHSSNASASLELAFERMLLYMNERYKITEDIRYLERKMVDFHDQLADRAYIVPRIFRNKEQLLDAEHAKMLFERLSHNPKTNFVELSAMNGRFKGKPIDVEGGLLLYSINGKLYTVTCNKKSKHRQFLAFSEDIEGNTPKVMLGSPAESGIPESFCVPDFVMAKLVIKVIKKRRIADLVLNISYSGNGNELELSESLEAPDCQATLSYVNVMRELMVLNSISGGERNV